MRIVIINHEFPPVGGGAATAAREIAAGIAARGHGVRVLTGSFARLPRQETTDGYEVCRLPALRHSAHRSTPAEMLSFGILALAPALGHVRRFRPDVCIAFFGVPGGIIALAARVLWRVSYIVSLRGGDVPGYPAVGPFSNLALPLTLPIWRGASALVANSPHLQDLARATASRVGREVVYIPNGVEIERFHWPRRSRAEAPVHLLFVGRLSREKGPDVLLRALSLLRKEERTLLNLSIVGDGPLRPGLETQAAEVLPGRAVFLGWRPREELPSIYAAADVLVLSSLMEGMPNVVLEAMAAGLPVVASNVGGCRVLVRSGENGLLVEPGSAEALAAALSTVVRQRDRLRDWGEASRRLAEAFSWDRVVDQYLELAEAVVTGRRMS